MTAPTGRPRKRKGLHRNLTFSVKEMAEALRQTGGNATTAAAHLNRLEEQHAAAQGRAPRHISGKTINDHRRRRRALQRACDDGLLEVLDLAEGTVFKQVLVDGNLALRFLEMKAKDRGYTRRTEHTANKGEPLPAPQFIFIPADAQV